MIVPKKFLSQHFLKDKHIKQKIVNSCQLHPEDTVLEIGPGQGVLTREIAAQVGRLYAVETDVRLCHNLQETLNQEHVQVFHADILQFPLERLAPGPVKVIGNLPFHISTPLLEQLITFRKIFPEIFITVQYEFGMRLCAKVNTRSYSALSCFVQSYYEVTKLFKIKNTAFDPVPKVHSCFLHLKQRDTPAVKEGEEEKVFSLIRAAFQHRRKKILNALAFHYSKSRLEDLLPQLNISPQARAENLTIEDYVNLARKLSDNPIKKRER